MADPGLLLNYGWSDSVAESFDPHLHIGSIPARVVRVDRGESYAATSDGIVRARTTADPVCTGDWVVLDEYHRVAQIIQRRSEIRRASAGAQSASQLLATNIDTVLVVAALDQTLSLGRVERLLALAWESGAQPVAVLTKSDLANDLETTLDEVRASAPGVPVVAVGATTGDGMDVLTALLTGTVVLLGASGAGKSTLANALLGEECLATNDVRGVDGKGRHTTVARELVPLPFGGQLIDTPGLRGVGLWDVVDGLNKAFADVEEFGVACRFGDCAHSGEPGCAVQEAIDAGLLPQRRLDSYRKLARENEWMAARSDARLRAERTRAVKIQTRASRSLYRSRR
ncbi:ribosome small subunit-dependent GTPase A [Aldersonia sp. NBC_00410]|uniref:ribosome small subunit-dependent GTPase A n=1 Tax=Aldersonia sp. NBC_00410 TaxID=2975954 RepID=UPI00224F44C8|nr:ribosome small subunit-dependent GTPase A [Aldersonia sp. NBC_00410]MCX5042206.1 ribosome small subunit-dependent GTPase A [Aldersonia sp. NBC_00410]